MAFTNEEIEKLALWSAPQEVQTKYGPRILRKAQPTEEFSEVWKTRKDEVKATGAGFSKTLDGKWELAWWQKLPEEVVAKREQSFEASKAVAVDIALPKPEGYDYMPFQKAGIQYALARPHVLIADEMGLGKTIQAIGIINADPEIKSALIICPKSLKINWKRELERWLVRPLTVGVANGSWPSTDIVVINYDSLSKYAVQLREHEWGALILDEAHLIKNGKTQRSQNIKGHSGKPADEKKGKPAVPPLAAIQARRHIRLTGTPIVNRPVELHNIIADLHPDWKDFMKFARRYAGGYKGRHGWDFNGAKNLDELQRRLRETIMVRRLKAEVLTELPPKIRQIVVVEAETSAQRKAVQAEQEYEAASYIKLADLRALVELSKAESEDAYKAAVARLRDASGVAFTEMANLRHETAIVKLPLVIANLENALEDNDNKIIVGAHHHDMVNGLMEGLAKFNPVKLTGEENEKQRDEAVNRFQTDPTCRVFIGSIQAAGVGITLHASSHVVFSELDWVPGNMSQFEDRAHRIGQTQTVLVQHIVLEDSLDARMAQTLVAKQAIIEQALDGQHPERQQPVYEPKDKATTHGTTVEQVVKEAEELTPEQVALIHAGLKLLAGLDQDFAQELNGAGFNKIDGIIGHSLAEAPRLSRKQAVLGAKLVKKYHRQLPAEIMAAVKEA